MISENKVNSVAIGVVRRRERKDDKEGDNREEEETRTEGKENKWIIEMPPRATRRAIGNEEVKK